MTQEPDGARPDAAGPSHVQGAPHHHQHATTQTVEQVVRAQISKALGGRRGIAESAVPTLTFTISWIVGHDLKASLIASLGVAVVLVVVRLVQRGPVQFVLNALIGITIAAVFAARSGEAKDVFLPGLLYNTGYGVVMVLSVLVGWPLMGFLVGSVTGDPTQWHDDHAIVRLCSRLTWILAIPCLLRVVVQYPLYAGDHVGLLGATKIVMGWPLQLAALLAMGWVLSRNTEPPEVPHDDVPAPR